MSNLGNQGIVEEAKRFGGVDSLIKTIEDNAVDKNAQRVFVKGSW